MALAKHNRMTRKDFSSLFRSGTRVRGAHCSIHYGTLEGEHSQVAVVVQAKAVSQAVERNRIRRVLFEYLGTIIPVFTGTFFIVVIVHTAPKDVSLQECKRELNEMLRKSGIIKS